MTQLEGFAKGSTEESYPGVDAGVPLLSSFYFRFEKPNDPGDVDNHINALAVYPAGAAQDLTPNAGLPPKTVTDGKVLLMYRDDDVSAAKDNYFYNVAHFVQPAPSLLLNARRFQVRDVGCRGECRRVLPRPPGDADGIFALVGFQIFYTGNRDHEIDQIAVFEEGGVLTVRLNDKNDDDVFGFFVDYALVRSPLAGALSVGELHGEAAGGARIELPHKQKFIRGFSFDYKKSDHHLREIGVLMRNAHLEVFFGDKNRDDRFNWSVRWAALGDGEFV
jgi:hypothetical protein